MNMSGAAQCPLFANIDENQFKSLSVCLAATVRGYHKDECIFWAGNKINSVGVVLAGGVHVLQEDFWGRRMILTHIGPGGLFGAAFSCAQHGILPFTVTASEPSEILLLNLQKIMTTCESSCVFHTQLIMNLVQILSQKYISLTQKVNYLSQKSIRNKLLSFLSEQAVQTGSNIIKIPFSRQELADYLYVDRSALSRELSAMQSEGLLRYSKRKFELLNP